MTIGPIILSASAQLNYFYHAHLLQFMTKNKVRKKVSGEDFALQFELFPQSDETITETTGLLLFQS